MDASRQIPPLRQHWPGYRCLFPGLAGVIMITTGLLPWYNDPTGSRLTAWQLPIELGWQLHVGVLNYGVLCTACALYAFYLARQAWLVMQNAQSDDPPTLLRTPRLAFARHQTIAALLCLIPPLLYSYQFLCADIATIAHITHVVNQLQLTQSHFGYAGSPHFIQIQPFLFNPLHFSGRWALLVDRVSYGFFLPLISLLILLASRKLYPHRRLALTTLHMGWWRQRRRLLIGLTLGTIILFGRAPAALLCVGQAEHLLASGSYADVIHWLDAARILNPTLDLLPDYHQLRGQAAYYTAPHQLDAEGHIYLASYYRAKYDTLSSYQEVLTAWHMSPQTAWLKDELFLSLAQLIESTKPVQGIVARQVTTNVPAIRWINEIIGLDPHNFYAHYMLGRINCDLHAYQDCKTQMQRVLQLNQSNEIRSSAYGYMAFSEFGLGNNVAAREDLYSAQRYDNAYRNNPVRQRMSGMR
jgi:hypothetical protein